MGKSEWLKKMKYRVCLIADNHFILGVDRNYYVNGTYTEQYLRRFTTNFDEVVVVARGREAKSEDEVSKLRLSGGEKVSFCILPDFNGIEQYVKLKCKIKKRLLKEFSDADAVFVRMPCILTTVSIKCAKALNKPFMIDVGADPATIYLSSPPTVIERLLSSYMRAMCKKECMEANGVSYVTQRVLQEKYPCKAIVRGETKEYFTASISNADISMECYSLRKYNGLDNNIKLLHISNNICEKSGKGHDEAIHVLSYLVKKGANASLTFVGDGDGIDYLKKIAQSNDVIERVSFTGRIADRNEYYRIIRENDIFLFPSHSEGLPRVLLEVMATGMLCVSSNVDGIPEILDEKDIFDIDDIKGFSDRIMEYIKDYNLVLTQSKRNFEVARQYSNINLKHIYDKYYEKVRRLIELVNQ